MKRKLTSICSLFLALVTAVAFAGCGKAPTDDGKKNSGKGGAENLALRS